MPPASQAPTSGRIGGRGRRPADTPGGSAGSKADAALLFHDPDIYAAEDVANEFYPLPGHAGAGGALGNALDYRQPLRGDSPGPVLLGRRRLRLGCGRRHQAPACSGNPVSGICGRSAWPPRRAPVADRHGGLDCPSHPPVLVSTRAGLAWSPAPGQGQAGDAREFRRTAGLAPPARVVLSRGQLAVPGQQRRGCHGKDLCPAPAGKEPSQRSEPHPVGRSYRIRPVWRRSTAFSCRSTSNSAAFARSPRNTRTATPSTRHVSR